MSVSCPSSKMVIFGGEVIVNRDVPDGLTYDQYWAEEQLKGGRALTVGKQGLARPVSMSG